MVVWLAEILRVISLMQDFVDEFESYCSGKRGSWHDYWDADRSMMVLNFQRTFLPAEEMSKAQNHAHC